MIKPSVGRIVLYRAAGSDPAADPHAALVVGVIDDRTVNLAIFNADGAHYQGTAVPLLQDDDQPPEGQGYAEWMPFQKGQAGKTEAVEGNLEAKLTDRLTALEKALNDKLAELGNWTVQKFGEVDARIPGPGNTPPAPAEPTTTAGATQPVGAGQAPAA